MKTNNKICIFLVALLIYYIIGGIVMGAMYIEHERITLQEFEDVGLTIINAHVENPVVEKTVSYEEILVYASGNTKTIYYSSFQAWTYGEVEQVWYRYALARFPSIIGGIVAVIFPILLLLLLSMKK